MCLCGCEVKELENRDFVLQMLIDGNSEYNCQLGVAEFSQQKNNTSISMEYLYGSGPTLVNALEKINRNSSKGLYFAHTQICVLSLDALKNDNTLKELIALSENNNQLNRRILLMATDTPQAFSFDEEGYIFDFVNSYYQDNSKYKNRNVMSDLGRVKKQLLENNCCIIPIIHIENENITIDRCGLINNYSLLQEITQQQCEDIMWLMGVEKPESFFQVMNNKVAVKLKQTGIDKKAYEDKLVINIKAQAQVLEDISQQYVNNEKIKAEIENKLKNRLEDTFSFLQKDLRVDCIGIKELYLKNNYGVYMNNRDNIDDFIYNLPVEINISVDI